MLDIGVGDDLKAVQLSILAVDTINAFDVDERQFGERLLLALVLLQSEELVDKKETMPKVTG